MCMRLLGISRFILWRMAAISGIRYRHGCWRRDHIEGWNYNYAGPTCSHYQAEKRHKFIEPRYAITLPSECEPPRGGPHV